MHRVLIAANLYDLNCKTMFLIGTLSMHTHALPRGIYLFANRYGFFLNVIRFMHGIVYIHAVLNG